MTQYTYEDEIDLRDLIMVIWRGRWWIILAVLVAAAAAFVYATFMKDPVYEATVSFLAPDYQLANGETLRQSDYLPVFRKESIGKDLVDRHSLAPSGSDIERAVDELLSSMEVKPQANSSVIAVSLQHKDRAVALDILRDYAGLIQSEVASFAAGINEGYLERVESALEARRSAYQTALEELEAFEEDYHLEGMRSVLRDRESRLTSIAGRIKSLQSSKEATQVSLEEAQSQLAITDPLIVTRDTLDEASLRLFARIGENDPTAMMAIEREQVNPIYMELVQTIQSAQRQLESWRAELLVLATQKSELEEEIATIQRALPAAERAETEIMHTVRHAQRAYESADSDYANAASFMSVTDYSIQVVNGPWASTSPVGPGRMMIMALAVVLAGFVSVFGVLFADYMRSSERRAMQPPTDTVAQ